MFPVGCARRNSCRSQHPCFTRLDAIVFPRQTFPARLGGCPALFLPAYFCSAQSPRFPPLQRPSFGISRKVWEQVEQQPVGGIQLDAKIVNPPISTTRRPSPYFRLAADRSICACQVQVVSNDRIRSAPISALTESREGPPIPVSPAIVHLGPWKGPFY